MKIIGITGNSGSGKSAVSRILAELGGYIIDADALTHQIMASGESGYKEILGYFGRDILGAYEHIDRKKLGAIVWNDREKLNKLMEITHKYVVAETFAQIEKIHANPGCYRFIVIDAPLLIEAGMHKSVDAVWLVYADEAVRLQRIIARDGITVDAAIARMRNQTPDDVLRVYADVVIENTGGLYALKEKIIDVLRL